MSESAPPDAPPRADPGSTAALERFANRMRPWRIAYASGIVVALLVLLVIVKIAYSHGEISHATLHTVPAAPKSIAPQSPSAAPTQAWRTSDASALGVPFSGGTVVTYNAHSVRGRDARTGKITWSYTRTDRTVCTALQASDVTVAVYELNGNCDELTGLDTGTGQRQWTRTLDKDSNQINRAINGHPHYAVAPYTVMIWTSHIIYAIDPSGDQDRGSKSGGLDRWVFAHAGCTINDAVLGSSGALISQTCTAQNCSDLKFCGNGRQLLLRDPTEGEEDDRSKNNGNPDQLKWNRLGSNLVPASADSVVSATSPDGTQLVVLSQDKGVITQQLPLSGGTGTAQAVGTGDTELIRFAGVTYVVQHDTASFRWQTETDALPTITADSGLGSPTLDRARITVPTSGGIATLNPSDGKPLQQFSVPPPAAGSLVYPFGTGFLVAGADTVLYQ